MSPSNVRARARVSRRVSPRYDYYNDMICKTIHVESVLNSDGQLAGISDAMNWLKHIDDKDTDMDHRIRVSMLIDNSSFNENWYEMTTQLITDAIGCMRGNRRKLRAAIREIRLLFAREEANHDIGNVVLYVGVLECFGHIKTYILRITFSDELNEKLSAALPFCNVTNAVGNRFIKFPSDWTATQ